MPLTKEELMKPRIKVIADYPESPFEVGEVLFYDTNRIAGPMFVDDLKDDDPRYIIKMDADKYPHLFKPLQWWEERAESDMPKYVKIPGGAIREVFKYKYYPLSGLFIDTAPLGDYDDNAKDCIPSDLEEYTTYQSFNQNKVK